MLEKQKQQIGNNSTGIQVQRDLVLGPNYTDIRAIFLDLFQLNFPKVQEIASKTADERVEKLLEELEYSFRKHKDVIDAEKFTDPSLQYEMQSIAINVARRGEKSNIKLLTELLCTVASRDCPELIELISSESLKIIPMLSKKHIDYLSLMVLSSNASMGNNSAVQINLTLQSTLKHISDSETVTAGDIQYIACKGAIESRGISIKGMRLVPSILKKSPELKGMKLDDIKVYCSENNLESILKLIDLIEKCAVDHFHLMAIGKLIGWLNLSKFSNVDIKKLF